LITKVPYGNYVNPLAKYTISGDALQLAGRVGQEWLGWLKCNLLDLFQICHFLYPVNRKPRRNRRKEEGDSIDPKPTKSGPTPGETESEGKTYCKDHPGGVINLRSYSGDWYQQSCSDLAARIQATSDVSYKIDPD
jgi:hypothetical protein